MQEPMRIVVAGGGIGGVSAAIALRRAGFDAQLFERAPELREVGAALSLWPNATRILREWGVLAPLLRVAHAPPTFEVRSWRGERLQRVPLQEADAPTLFVHRADLLAALADALPPWALHLGAELESFSESAEGVVARFRDWGEADGAALVGADGLHSTTRRLVLDDGAPVYRGYPVWRGVACLEHPAIGGSASETLGPGRRAGVLPLGDGRVAWWATANEPEGTPDGNRKARLLRLFGNWHAPIPQLIEATPGDEILKNATCDRPPRRTWGRGRVTLLGDAAHPTTPNLGQGGCLAIEDAAVLARALAREPDVPAALRAYERRRYPRTAAITRMSHRLGSVGQWERPLAVATRGALFRLTPAWAARLSLRRVNAFRP